jgi:L-gulonate 3-dehydrogenase
MPRIAVIGAGLIGRSWAIVFAAAGWNVTLHDADPSAAETALAGVAEGLADLARHGLVEDAPAAGKRVRIAATLAQALEGASFVQENLPETVAIKQAIFTELDRRAAPDAILASSTSSIVPSLFTESLPGRQRCLVAHPVNPPHLVPLVELLGSPWTQPAIITKATQIYQAVGQVPIIVNRDIEGFILNRLQGALLAEAFRLVGDGYVSPQDLDKTLQDGLGLRWSFMGPFATIELNAPGGMSDYCARYAGFYRRLQENPATAAVFEKENVERILAQWNSPPVDRLPGLARERDQRLAALKAHKSRGGVDPIAAPGTAPPRSR